MACYRSYFRRAVLRAFRMTDILGEAVCSLPWAVAVSSKAGSPRNTSSAEALRAKRCVVILRLRFQAPSQLSKHAIHNLPFGR
jgi:hypothetical protein